VAIVSISFTLVFIFTKMKVAAMIPARLASTRLPEKLLQQIGEFNVLQTTYLNAVATGLFSEVIVVADDEKLGASILQIGGTVKMSTKPHETGTDRIAEFAADIDAEIIINIQADEPEVNKDLIEKLIKALQEDSNADISTPMHRISAHEATNTNYVKVLCNAYGHAMLFSRSIIPFVRDADQVVDYYKHVGIYAFRTEVLIAFAELQPPIIELAEKLENLRMLYYGMHIKMVESATSTVGIDTAQDLIAYKLRHGLD
jgi:3-deoxy-manno-octulosonate cytidylyltransferase (CMP-KDO synthetase)